MPPRKKRTRDVAGHASASKFLSQFDEHAFPTLFVNDDLSGKLRVEGDSEEQILAYLVWDMAVRKALEAGVDLWSDAGAWHWAAVQLVVRGTKAVPVLMTDDQVAEALAESRQQRQRRPAAGLSFDDARLTVTLGSIRHRIANPRAYHVFKAIATRDVPKITRGGIRQRVPGVNGQKTIRDLIDNELQIRLRTAIKSDTHGFWLQLR
jgi:hypothetical protein